MSRYPRWLVRSVLLIVVPALAVAGGVAFWLMSGRYVETENAYVKADIAQVSAEVAGRVAEIHAKDHQTVAAGDVLIRLDPRPFEVALARAEAEVDVARHEVATLLAAWREAESELVEAQGRQSYFAAQLERQQLLAERGIISSTKLEEVESEARQARDRVTVVRQKVSRMLAQIGGDPKAGLDSHPMVREKIAAREQAALDLARTTVKASVGGHVVGLKLQPGEHVRAALPLFAIVVATRPWVEANFKETQLTHIRPGMAATVVLDIYPDVTWKAEIDTISPATGAEFALLPPQNASGNWVKVVQRLPVKLRLEPQEGEPPLRAGMTATVSVDTKRERSLKMLPGGEQLLEMSKQVSSLVSDWLRQVARAAPTGSTASTDLTTGSTSR